MLRRAIGNVDRLSAAVTIGLQLTRTDNGDLAPLVKIGFSSLQASSAGAGLRFENGSADLVVENHIVRLDHLNGDVAQGRLSLAGEILLSDGTGQMNGRVEGVAIVGTAGIVGHTAEDRRPE